MASDESKDKNFISGIFKKLRKPSKATSVSSHETGSSEPTSPRSSPALKLESTLPSLDSKLTSSLTTASESSTHIAHLSTSSSKTKATPESRQALGLVELTSQDGSSSLAKGWADVVAIHGIGGDAYRTWTAANGTMWLRDLLPKDVEGLSVFSFGYDATVWPTKAKGTIESFARSLLNDLRMMWLERGKENRPLVFVCHSMGGIILKKAFIIARLSPESEYTFMKQSVKGIIFMGTPHQGSEAVKFPMLLANLVDVGLYFGSGLTGKARKDLLQELAKDSKTLEMMATEFANQIGEINIVSCVERRATPPLSCEIVTRQSALLNLPGERIIMMDGCDHRTICQFPTASDHNYRVIRSQIKEILEIHSNHIRPETISDCLQYLQFPEMSNRYHDINSASVDTCAWLLKHPKFKKWSEQKQRLLWIRGKPGAGKSTLMKYALQMSVRESAVPEARIIVLSFFFHGRGMDLQKSAEGFYRSVLHQLLSRMPYAVEPMLHDFDQNVFNRGKAGQAWNWHIREYQKHLTTTLATLSKKFKFSVRIFIDALDEGGEATAQAMVDEFQCILEDSKHEAKVAICFSCRHYPVIDVDDQHTIVVENENENDIQTFLKTSFRQDASMATVRDIILSKATGSFQWTYLVVDLVKRKRRQGSLPQQIQKAIQDIPPELNKLYRELLNTIPEEELPAVTRLFEWMLFARYAVSVDELRIATAIDPDLPYKSLEGYRDHGLLLENNDDFGRRLTTISRGLAEVIELEDSNGDPGGKMVQFNHQSVIDFLTEDGLQILLGSQWQSHDLAFGRAHHTISRICLHYISMNHHVPERFTQLIQEATGDWGQDTYQLFAPYAVQNWLYHVQEAHLFGISQADLLDCFQWPSTKHSDRWIDLCHKIDRNAYYYAPRKSTLLHILAEYGLIDTIALALSNRDRRLAQELVNVKNEYGETPMFWAANVDRADIVKLLLEHGADPNSQNLEGRTILSCAAVRGADEVVRLLLGCEHMDLESKDCDGRTPLARAAERGRPSVVQLLLEHGAKPELSDFEHRTPLLLASENGHEAVVKLLLAADGVQPNFSDDIQRTPLSWAARNGRSGVVQTLLNCNVVGLNALDKDRRSPLSLAVEFRRDDVVDLLLAHKADIDLRDKSGRTPLSWAASSPGDFATSLSDVRGNNAVEKLLQAGADMESIDNEGRTPLSWAAASPNRWGHNPAVEALLKHGAKADSKDKTGRTPLSWAAGALPLMSQLSGWQTNFALDILLGRDDVNARSRDASGHDALWWAHEQGSSRSDRRLTGWYRTH